MRALVLLVLTPAVCHGNEFSKACHMLTVGNSVLRFEGLPDWRCPGVRGPPGGQEGAGGRVGLLAAVLPQVPGQPGLSVLDCHHTARGLQETHLRALLLQDWHPPS